MSEGEDKKGSMEEREREKQTAASSHALCCLSYVRSKQENIRKNQIHSNLAYFFFQKDL
jgi:hypothetical protein